MNSDVVVVLITHDPEEAAVVLKQFESVEAQEVASDLQPSAQANSVFFKLNLRIPPPT